MKDQAADLSKQLASSNCDNLKLKSEMKTLGMNVAMKEEAIKRLKEDLSVLNEKNNRLMSTMDTEAKNTSKLADQYMGMREENVKLQIALESSKKRSAMYEDQARVSARNISTIFVIFCPRWVRYKYQI